MSWVGELKRRNVVRVAALYLLAGWITLQVTQLLFGLLELPDWSTKLVLGMLLVGFPLVLLFIFTTMYRSTSIAALGGISYAQYFVPGIVAFGVISACYSNIAITLCFRRDLGVLKRLRGTPLTVVCTVRPVEYGHSDDVGRALTVLSRQSGSRRIVLRRLDEVQTAQLAGQTLGPGTDGDLLAGIHERSDGNPFFATEIARLVAAGHRLDEVPAGVRDVVGRRLAELPAAARAMVDLAAVVGCNVDLRLLARAGRGRLQALRIAEVQRLGDVHADADGIDRGDRGEQRGLALADQVSHPALRLADEAVDRRHDAFARSRRHRGIGRCLTCFGFDCGDAGAQRIDRRAGDLRRGGWRLRT